PDYEHCDRDPDTPTPRRSLTDLLPALHDLPPPRSAVRRTGSLRKLQPSLVGDQHASTYVCQEFTSVTRLHLVSAPCKHLVYASSAMDGVHYTNKPFLSLPISLTAFIAEADTGRS